MLRLSAGEIDATNVGTPVSIPGQAVTVDPDAPAKILRRSHHSAKSVDFFVISGMTGAPQWQMTTKSGSIYVAEPDGSGVHKLV